MINRGLQKALLFIALAGMLNAVQAYVLLGAKWPADNMQFDYGLMLHGSNRSDSGQLWNQAFAEAAQAWNEEINFTIQTDDRFPSHPCAGVDGFSPDGFRNGAAFYHQLCFQDPTGGTVEEYGDRVLAVTISYSYTSAPDEIIETDIFFNDAEDWDIYDGQERFAFDFKRVATHEMGHVLGLGHEEFATALMQPTVSDLYTLQADDIAGAAVLYGALNTGEPIVMNIEEPFNGSVQSGISTFRGWVVSQYELSSLILYLNGSYKGLLEHSGPRSDVCVNYAQYPDCDKSGFAFAMAYGALPEGANNYRLEAYDVMGNKLVKSVNFNVSRFADPYVTEDEVSLANASLAVDYAKDEIIIDNLLHNGENYRVYLQWKRQSQSFEPTGIVPK